MWWLLRHPGTIFKGCEVEKVKTPPHTDSAEQHFMLFNIILCRNCCLFCVLQVVLHPKYSPLSNRWRSVCGWMGGWVGGIFKKIKADSCFYSHGRVVIYFSLFKTSQPPSNANNNLSFCFTQHLNIVNNATLSVYSILR